MGRITVVFSIKRAKFKNKIDWWLTLRGFFVVKALQWGSIYKIPNYIHENRLIGFLFNKILGF
jgi:hypothetical protein